jgi:uncharacterized membrane protein (UPF0127 family)
MAASMIQSMRALNRTRGTVLCQQLESAGGLAGQGRGLLGRDGLASNSGMLFVSSLPLMWMHMFFMRFPIDIVFLDREGRVLHICHQLEPWRLSPIVWRARKALELRAGAASASFTQPGDIIELT